MAWPVPAVREEACERAVSQCAASHRVIHITVFCLGIVHWISKVCSVSDVGCISSSGQKKAYFVKLFVMTYMQKIGIVQTKQYETCETN